MTSLMNSARITKETRIYILLYEMDLHKKDVTTWLVYPVRPMVPNGFAYVFLALFFVYENRRISLGGTWENSASAVLEMHTPRVPMFVNHAVSRHA